MAKPTTLPVALVQDRDHGSRDANLANIEDRVAEAAKRGAAAPSAGCACAGRAVQDRARMAARVRIMNRDCAARAPAASLGARFPA